MVTALLHPSSRIRRRRAGLSPSASTWMFSRSAPALAKGSMYFSGWEIMRCTSKKAFVARRRDLTTGTPMEMLGTKWPSMTSTWSQSAPASRTRSQSRWRLAKSAERMEGASMVIRKNLLSAECRGLGRAPPHRIKRRPTRAAGSGASGSPFRSYVQYSG